MAATKPRPDFIPAGRGEEDVKIQVVLPYRIHRSLKVAAAEHGLTLTQVIQAVLANSVKQAMEAAK